MEYAVAIADELNFTWTAARCRIGQSGLSHQITQLEREIGPCCSNEPAAVSA
ncbi:LysR family transcriptional regulator [Streptomyces sp. NPDC051987]|uniref:helix-turn-helix domain-containing protein n=1 Tax=Streptomyces sp. NPDC051987 TaxID=3155808 RepID=UPI00343D12E3